MKQITPSQEKRKVTNDELSRRYRKVRSVIDADSNLTPMRKPPRPACTRCGREMIQAHITAGSITFASWLCDCVPQPPSIVADIVRAREWDDEVLFYTIEYKSDGD